MFNLEKFFKLNFIFRLNLINFYIENFCKYFVYRVVSPPSRSGNTFFFGKKRKKN